MKKMKLIIVGTSWISESFRLACNLAGGIDCVGVYSRELKTARKFCRNKNIKNKFDDINAAAAFEGADSVYIASPNACHYEQIKLFLENGKNVLCEKPITVDLDQLKELYALAKSKNLVLLHALMPLYNTNMLLLKNLLNTIGDISVVRFDLSKISSKIFDYRRGELPNVFNPEMQGGALNDVGIYNIATSILLFGYPKKIASSLKYNDKGLDVSGSALFFYDDFTVDLTFSKIGQSQTISEIIGDNATITIGSLTKTSDIVRHCSNNKKARIAFDMTQEEAMKFEADVFRNIVGDKEKYVSKLNRLENESLSIIKALNEIRDQNRI